jgi:hypothetical protein
VLEIHSAPLEIVVGEGPDVMLTLRVHHRLEPAASDAWTRAQLAVEIHVVSGTHEGQRSLTMFADDFHVFAETLARFAEGARKGAGFDSGDSFSVTIFEEAPSGLHAWVQLDQLSLGHELPRELGFGDGWKWRIPLSRTFAPPLLEQLTRVVARYPERSVSPPG